MVKVPPKVKELKSYDELRRLRNHLRDDYKTLKCKTGSKVKVSTSKIKEYLERERLTEIQKKEIYESIINRNRSIMDLYDFGKDAPLVSIIIINKNDLEDLKRVFHNFSEKSQYPNYEILVVDNASTDNSVKFLKELSEDLPIKIIANKEHESFSRANNKAAESAEGEYLLLLKNDVEPTYGWLNQMMQTALKSKNDGAVGAKLVYPDCSESQHNQKKSFKTKHTGIVFHVKNGFVQPYNRDNGKSIEFSTKDRLRAAVSSLALLIEKKKYFQVGGLDELYVDGYEDVDFCLKLLKRGYKNIYCSKALLFHHDLINSENKSKKVKKQIKNNKKLFQQRWDKWLRREFLMDKLNCELLFSEKPLKIAFAVTQTGKTTSAGDYFTALALGNILKKFGWEIIYLSQRGSEDWYNVDEDVDVLISLLDSYNIHKIRSKNNLLIKVAWPRNWFSRWVSNPDFINYNIVFAPSNIACDYITKKTGVETFLLPLAADPHIFNSTITENEKLKCDYCFTGSYWGYPREIIDMLDPKSLPYTFKLYGKNWEKLKKFKNYHYGFVNYDKLPEVYRSTKIVVDDANTVTKEYGSVNSRVYDALASGVLVLTNGAKGAKEIFNGDLPVYTSKEELSNLLEYYLSNDEDRISKIKKLQNFVLSNHTYDQRAITIKKLLESYILETKIAIKIPVPNWEEIHQWGDYHMALGLKKELERKGCRVMLQILSEWDGDEDAHCDAVIVLRGLSRYKPKKHHFNIMWNISHPDDVTPQEYNQYDHVFIASELWAQKVAEEVDIPVETMLQCTDPELFYPDPDDNYKHDLIFVGNSRKVYRRIIKDILPTDKDLAVYGTNWKGIIPDEYIKGEHIPNNQLRKAYSSCKILLNDHWEDMKEKGFISNCLFDGCGAGAFIISDKVKGAEEVFGEDLITYETPEELHSLMEHYLSNSEERNEKAEKARNRIAYEHNFQKRAEKILEVLNKNLFN